MSISLTTISTLAGGSAINSLNNNFTAIQNALNNSLLWRTGLVPGESTMYRDLDMNGRSLMNAQVDGVSLLTIKNKALSASPDIQTFSTATLSDGTWSVSFKEFRSVSFVAATAITGGTSDVASVHSFSKSSAAGGVTLNTPGMIVQVMVVGEAS